LTIALEGSSSPSVRSEVGKSIFFTSAFLPRLVWGCWRGLAQPGVLEASAALLACSGEGESRPEMASSTEDPPACGPSLLNLSLADLNREFCFAETPEVREKSMASLSTSSVGCRGDAPLNS
jgi:hypothetical protein